MDLKEWGRIILNQRQKLGRIKEVIMLNNEPEKVIDNEGKEHKVIIEDDLRKAKPTDNCIIITQNNKKNVTELMNRWEEYVQNNATIYFINSNGSKWSINARVHNFIVEEKNLKKSLMSLYESNKE